MRRGAKPTKAKVEAELAAVRKSLKNEASRRRQLEKRLADAQEQQTAAAEALQTRTRELAEALEQQTATAEILRVIASSPTDLEPVMEAVAENAARVCGATDSSIYRLEGEHLRVVARHGLLRRSTAIGDSVSVSRDTIAGQVVRDRRTIHVEDIKAAEAEFPATLSRLRRVGSATRTVVGTPLLREGTPLGVIFITRAEVHPFSAKQIALLETFANQAVIAIENVRLFNELQAWNRKLTEALEQQTATADILRVLSGSPTDVRPVFETIAGNAARLCSAAFGAVARTDGNFIHLAALHNVAPGAAAVVERVFPVRLDRTSMVGCSILDRAVVHVPDVSIEPPTLGLDQILDYRSQLIVPMVREGHALGAIAVCRREAGAFSESQVALLSTFADQAVIAIENVRLFQELRARNAELTESLEQQTATSEILRVISSSPTDVQPVFEAIARSAKALCEAANAGVFRFDGGLIHLVAHHNWTPEQLEFVRRVFPIPPSRASATTRAILTRAVSHVPDITADPEYTASPIVEAGFRTSLAVPMLRDDRPIGAITVGRMEPRPFTDKQIALLQTFADQAVIAVENVRLFKELEGKNRDLSEALEQQTATSEVLKIISRSTFDLQPVLESLVENAVQLCRADKGFIYRQDGELYRIAASYGNSPEFIEVVRRNPIREDRGSATGRAVLERRPVHIHDILADSEYRWAEDQRGKEEMHRTILAVPMLREGAVIGVIVIRRTQVQPFTDRQIEVVTTFADQAVIAIENVRLFQELQTRTRELGRSVEELKALGEVSRAVSSTLDLETVLNTIVARAVQLSSANGGLVYEYDETKEEFNRIRGAHRLDEELGEVVRAAPIRLGEGVAGKAAALRAPVQLPDVLAEGTYDVARIRAVFERRGYRALLAVPLLFEQRIIGVLVVWREEPGSFAPEVVNLLQTFATQSVLAIQNARLFREIADKSQQLEAASRHKSEFLANMSHELRTPLNAILGFNEMILGEVYGDVPPDLKEPLTDIQNSGKHLLRLINDVLDLSKIEAGRMELELTDYAVQDTVERVRTSLHPLAAAKGLDFVASVPEDIPLAYGDAGRITQCLMNLAGNALKFTRQGRVGISVDLQGDCLVYRVADTGIGIAKDEIETVFAEFRQGDATITSEFGGTGLGLSITKKFVEMHRGRIWVESELGKGSTFFFSIPLRLAEGKTA